MLRAFSVSSRFLKSLEAWPEQTILSVHEHSLSLLCGEDVLVLAGSDAGNLPMGLLTDIPGGVAWKRTGLLPGGRTGVSGRYLVLSSDLRIDLSVGSLWQARRYLSLRPVEAEAACRVTRLAAGALSGAAGLGKAAVLIDDIVAGRDPKVQGEPYYIAAVQRLSALIRAFLRSDKASFLDSASGMVGLGIGLTPSCDDVLVGLIGSLVLLSDRIASLGWVRRVAEELVWRARGRTHPVAWTYLRCAARGEIGEKHERLLQSLVGGDVSASLEACESLRGFGHSSGGEIALGTLLAVEIAVLQSSPTLSS